jgi:hypothetical protein
MGNKIFSKPQMGKYVIIIYMCFGPLIGQKGLNDYITRRARLSEAPGRFMEIRQIEMHEQD